MAIDVLELPDLSAPVRPTTQEELDNLRAAYAVSKANPEEAAEKSTLAVAAGREYQALRYQSLGDVTRQINQERIARVFAENRGVADWAKNDPEGADIGSDDIGVLDRIAKKLTSLADDFENPIRAGMQTGLGTAEQGITYDNAMTQGLRDLTPDEQKRVSEIEQANLQNEARYEDSWLYQFANLLGTWSGSVVYTPSQTAAEAVAIGTVVGSAPMYSAGATALAAAGTTLSPVTGGFSLAAAAGATMMYTTLRNMYAIEGGQQYKELLDLGLSKQDAFVYSRPVALINAGLEVFPMAKFAKRAGKPVIDAAKKLIPQLAKRDALEMAWTWKQLGVDFALGYASGTAFETGTEVGQEINGIIWREIAKAMSGLDLERATPQEIADQVWSVAKATFKGMAIMSALGGMPSVVHGARQINRAKRDKQFMTDVAEATKETKLYGRSPSHFGQFISHIAGNDKKTLFIDGKTFKQIATEQGLTQDQVQTLFGDVGVAQLQKGEEHTDVEIPLASYAANISGTKLDAALQPHIRTEQDGYTYAQAVENEREAIREAQRAKEGLGDSFKQLTDEEVAQLEARDRERYLASAARARVRQGLIRSMTRAVEQGGINKQMFSPAQIAWNASMATRLYEKMAGKVGMPLEDFVRKFGADISYENAEGAGVVNRLDTPVDLAGGVESIRNVMSAARGEPVEGEASEITQLRAALNALPAEQRASVDALFSALVPAPTPDAQAAGAKPAPAPQFAPEVAALIERTRGTSDAVMLNALQDLWRALPQNARESIEAALPQEMREQLQSVRQDYAIRDFVRTQRAKQGGTPANQQQARAEAEMQAVRDQYEGTDKWMKAPNGKPTNLTERQWLQVRTPSFKAWFGDWENDPENASKIVDENGEPKVVYHGTRANFSEFQAKYPDGLFFFTTNREMADRWSRNRQPTAELEGRIAEARRQAREHGEALAAEYGDSLDERYDEFRQEQDAWERENLGLDGMTVAEAQFNLGAKVMPVFINARNVFDPSADWGESASVIRQRMDEVGASEEDAHKGHWAIWESKDVIDSVMKDHDSILLSEDGDGNFETIAIRNSAQVKSATENNGDFDTSNANIYEQQISSALPSEASVKRGLAEDPLFVRQWADANEALKNTEYAEQVLARLYENVPGARGAAAGATSTEDALERIVEHFKDNLIWLYNNIPAAVRDRAKLWYVGANRTANAWAVRYGLRLRQTAAIIAVFSPQTDWFTNMSRAERLLDIWFSVRRQTLDAETEAEFATFCATYKVDYDSVKGRTLEDLAKSGDLRAAAAWVRAYDSKHNSSAFFVLKPEGGTGDVYLSSKGEPRKFAFASADHITKALSIILDGSITNISHQIGSEFKVRNFYNNIYDPSNTHASTIDTHAVGADTLNVTTSGGESSASVLDNFGRPGNALSGQKGTYPFHFEAYRRAAEAVGIDPREMQSITWEAIRVLFVPESKKYLYRPVKAIWENYDRGELSLDMARELVMSLAGGFGKTAWEGTPFDDTITQTYDRSNVKLYDDIVQPEAEPALSLEVAPNPDDKEAMARWAQLTDDEKLSVTQDVVEFVIGRVALEARAFISEPLLQRGGFEGESNHSIRVTIADGGDYVRIARLFATYLNQKSVMAVSVKPGEGMFNCKIIRIKLPEGFGDSQVDELYEKQLDKLLDKNNQRLIEGHSTEGGIMTIIADAEKIEEIKAKFAEIGLPYTFDIEDGYAGFPEAYAHKEEAQNEANDPGRGEGVQEEASPRYDPDVWRETSALVDRKIQECLDRRAGQVESRSAEQAAGLQPGQVAPSKVYKQDDTPGTQVAYHGTPHQFDRFDLSHLGEGEGAQAHGWGLYFTGSLEVAQNYWSVLSDYANLGYTIEYDGKTYSGIPPELSVIKDFIEDEIAAKLGKELVGDADIAPDEEKVRAWIDAEIARHEREDALEREAFYARKKELKENPPDIEARAAEIDTNTQSGMNDLLGLAMLEMDLMDIDEEYQDYGGHQRKIAELRAIDPSKVKLSVSRHTVGEGRIFKVEIPEEHRFLREQDEMFDQSDFVRDALKKLLERDDLPIDARDIIESALGIIGDQRKESLRREATEISGKIEALKKRRVALWNEQDKKVKAKVELFEREFGDPLSEASKYFAERLFSDEWESTPEGKELTSLNQQIGAMETRAERIDYLLSYIDKAPDGEHFYDQLATVLGSPKAASEMLLSAGIQGISYYGQRDGQCWVVFDDKRAKVLRYWQALGEKGAINLRAEMQDSLDTARKLEESGRSALDIKVATGWERGIDGKWRYEIPDGEVRPWRVTDGEYALKDFYDAAEMYRAYPELANVRIAVEPYVERSTDAYCAGDRIVINSDAYEIRDDLQDLRRLEAAHAKAYAALEHYFDGYSDAERDEAEMRGRKLPSFEEVSGAEKKAADKVEEKRKAIAKQMKHLVVHEIQHWIQDKEGFDQGTSAEKMSEVIDTAKRATALWEEFETLDNGTHEANAPQRWLNTHQQEVADIKVRQAYEMAERAWNGSTDIDDVRRLASLTPSQAYRNKGGEVEARAESDRSEMSDEERRNSLISSSYDVVPEDALIIDAGSGMAASEVAAPGLPRGSFDPVNNTVRLTPNANLSTFSHEMGHWYLETLSYFVSTGQADQGLVNDFNRLLTAFEVNSVAEWNALPEARKEVCHERWAAWVEEYLATGTCPEPSAKPMLRRFKDWIISVYKESFLMTGSVHSALSARHKRAFGEELPMLSDEVRKVLDHAMMSNEEMAQIEAQSGTAPLFVSKPESVSDEEWQDYQEAIRARTEEGREALAERNLEKMKWAQAAHSKRLRQVQAAVAKVRKECEAEARDRVLAPGTIWGKIEAIKRMPKQLRLSDEGLDQYLSAEQIALLKRLRIVAGKGSGIPLSDFCANWGINNPSEFLQTAVVHREAVRLHIDNLADQMMQERYPAYASEKDILNTVAEALAPEVAERMAATEIAFIDRQMHSTREGVALGEKRAEQMGVAGETATSLTRKLEAAEERLRQALRDGDDERAALAKAECEMIRAQIRNLDHNIREAERQTSHSTKEDIAEGKSRAEEIGVAGETAASLTRKLEAAEAELRQAVRDGDEAGAATARAQVETLRAQIRQLDRNNREAEKQTAHSTKEEIAEGKSRADEIGVEGETATSLTRKLEAAEAELRQAVRDGDDELAALAKAEVETLRAQIRKLDRNNREAERQTAHSTKEELAEGKRQADETGVAGETATSLTRKLRAAEAELRQAIRDGDKELAALAKAEVETLRAQIRKLDRNIREAERQTAHSTKEEIAEGKRQAEEIGVAGETATSLTRRLRAAEAELRQALRDGDEELAALAKAEVETLRAQIRELDRNSREAERQMAHSTKEELAEGKRQAEETGVEGETFGSLIGKLKTAEAELRQAVRDGDEAGTATIRAQVETLRAQIRKLARDSRNVAATTRAEMLDAQSAADLLLAKTPVGRISPNRYLALAKSAASRSLKAMAANDLQTALTEKRNQLVYQVMARRALEIQDNEIARLNRIRRQLNRSDEVLAKTRDPDILNFLRAVLGEFGMQTDKQVQAAASYIEAIREYDPDLAEGLTITYDRITKNAVQWQTLPYEDLRAFESDVSALWFMSRQVRQATLNGKKIELQEARKALLKQLASRYGGKSRGVRTATPTKKDLILDKLMSIDAGLRRVLSWCRDMDEGNDARPFMSLIYEPIKKGVDTYRIRQREVARKLTALYATYEKNRSKHEGEIVADELVQFDEFGNVTVPEGWHFHSKSQLIGALIHTGNASNKQKLIGGYHWGEIKTDETGKEFVDCSGWDAFIARMVREGVLTKADFDFVQGLWDIMEELKPETQKAYHDITGMYFAEITNTPLTVQFPDGTSVTYRGGYAPAKVDPDQVRDHEADLDRQLHAINQSYGYPTTGLGFTKSRTEAYREKLLMDVDLVAAHVNEALRMAHIELPARQVMRILSNRKFKNEFNAYANPHAIDKMIVPWLTRSVNQQVTAPMQNSAWKPFAQLITEIKRRTGLAAMAGNLANALEETSGFSVAATIVPVGKIRSAILDFTTGKLKADDVLAKSAHMRARLEDSDLYALERAEKAFKVDSTKLDKAQMFCTAHGYVLQQAVQRVVDIPVWWAAYNNAVENGHTEEEAVQIADETIDETMSVNTAEGISTIEGGNALERALLMFYNYFNMQYNLLHTELGRAIRMRKYGRAAWAFVTVALIPAIISDMFSRLLGARVGSDAGGDEDDWWLLRTLRYFSGQTLTAAFSTLPFLGQLGNLLADIASGEEQRFGGQRISMSPIANTGEAAFRLISKDIPRVLDGKGYRTAVRDAMQVITLATGVPLAQPFGRPLGYLADVAEGKADDDAVDTVRGLISGKSPNRK